MLKIYIQIFGTIALVAIILINYNIFYRTPAMDEVREKSDKLAKVQQQITVMDSILAHASKFEPVESVIDKDRELMRMELPTSFSLPDKTKRIYDLILACSLESTGIPVGAPLPAKPDAVKVTDVVALPTEGAFAASVESFKSAMSELDGKIPQFIAGTSPMDRWAFYDKISSGKDDYQKMKLSQGFERYRFRLNLTGTYANIKRFLWLVAHDKPLMQATSVRIVPKSGVGESRLFQLECVLIAYADRNTLYEMLNSDPVALLNSKPAGKGGAKGEAAKPAEGAADAKAGGADAKK